MLQVLWQHLIYFITHMWTALRWLYNIKKIVGHRLQAFGVGAFENEDEDIHGIESMANYDMVLGDEPQSGEKKNFGWTAPKHAVG